MNIKTLSWGAFQSSSYIKNIRRFGTDIFTETLLKHRNYNGFLRLDCNRKEKVRNNLTDWWIRVSFIYIC